MNYLNRLNTFLRISLNTFLRIFYLNRNDIAFITKKTITILPTILEVDCEAEEPTVKVIGPTVKVIGPTVKVIGPTVKVIGPTVKVIGPIAEAVEPIAVVVEPILTLSGLVEWWEDHPQYWFHSVSETDQLIIALFRDLFSKKHFLIKGDQDNMLGLILLYDQIARHIFRNQDDKIKYYHEPALRIAIIILDNGYDIEYTTVRQIFALMPLRHTFQEVWVKKAIDRVLKYRQIKDDSLYKRFYHASLISLSKIKTTNMCLIKTCRYDPNLLFDREILDPNSCSLGLSHAYHTMNTKIPVNGLFPVFKKMMDQLPRNRNQRLVLTLSVSGGVDSMVCSYLAWLYAKIKKDVDLKMVHINYDNRSSAFQESLLISVWCHLFCIPLWIRKIDEVHRDRQFDRDIYEDVTRKTRFDVYQKVGGAVVLGHNRDDSLENILANIRKKQHYDNLIGMKYIGEESGVTTLRPLLDISKADIYQYAKTHKIPYVYDSTPAWSERGRMRDQLIPAMAEFDPSLLSGLLEMNQTFRDVYGLYQKEIIDTTEILFESTKTARVLDKGIYLTDYWKTILLKITHHLKIPMVSNKAIKYFCQKIEVAKDKNIHLIFLSKFLKVEKSLDSDESLDEGGDKMAFYYHFTLLNE